MDQGDFTWPFKIAGSDLFSQCGQCRKKKRFKSDCLYLQYLFRFTFQSFYWGGEIHYALIGSLCHENTSGLG